ncbi:MAG: hypothetical protein V1694_00475 [Candidatus Eisenbacteria bacterium]
MPNQSEMDVLECFRDAKVEGKPRLIGDYCPFQENYIEMLMSSLEKEGMLEWDELRACRVISQKGLEFINRARPYKQLEDPTPKRKPPRVIRY